ncbi:hypothetical protein CRG98_002077 [Punica granatum]|uniref:Uncharacterized protein n=1 Tax=Punica granatum TaxID=22663 RepID=A0A2I0L9W5_PUNGR|nr:hypothetical protein CRG98_002077 [Punica granatum]
MEPMKAPAAESPAKRRKHTTGPLDEAAGTNELESEASTELGGSISRSESESDPVPGEVADAIVFRFSHSPPPSLSILSIYFPPQQVP